MHLTPHHLKLGLTPIDRGARVDVRHAAAIDFEDINGQRFVVLHSGSDDPEQRMPMLSGDDTLTMFVERWVEPAQARARAQPLGAEYYAQLARLRTNPPATWVHDPEWVMARFFIGEAGRGTMAGIEQMFDRWPWAAEPPLKKASEDGGMLSQYRTLLSNSILTIERRPFGRTVGFGLTLQYRPQETGIDWAWYTQHLPTHAAQLPAHCPPDLLACLFNFSAAQSEAAVVEAFAVAQTRETLIPLIVASTPGHFGGRVADWIAAGPMDYLRGLAVLGADSRGDAPDVVAAALARDDLSDTLRGLLDAH